MNTNCTFPRDGNGLWPLALLAVVGLFAASPTCDAGLITRNVDVTLDAANIESYDLDVDLNEIGRAHV